MAYIEKSEEICNFHLSNLRKSAFESAANCAMESVSPRTAGGRPVSSMAESIAARSSSEKAERSAFESVFRRWANAARTVRKKSFSSSTLAGGAARRSMRTTALVTFGCGTKQCGGTSKRSFGSAYHCTSTENAPYSPVPRLPSGSSR